MDLDEIYKQNEFHILYCWNRVLYIILQIYTYSNIQRYSAELSYTVPLLFNCVELEQRLHWIIVVKTLYVLIFSEGT